MRKLIDGWLTYAAKNKIQANNKKGRPPEDTDLADYLTQQGFEASQFQPLINKLPTAGNDSEEETSDEPELDKTQVIYLNKIKQLLKTLPKEQLVQIRRELKGE